LDTVAEVRTIAAGQSHKVNERAGHALAEPVESLPIPLLPPARRVFRVDVR
jgi:hypothetical protein